MILASGLFPTGSAARRQGNGGTVPIRPNTPVTQLPPNPTVLPPGPASPPVVPPLSDGPALSADDAARLALARLPALESARGATQTASGRVRVAESGLNPTLGFTAGYTLTEPLDGNRSSGGSSGGTTGSSGGGGGGLSDPVGDVLFGGSTSLRTSLNGTILLTDFGRTLAGVRQARATREAAVAFEEVTAQDAAFAARTRLFDLLQNRRLVAVAESNLANRQRQLALAEARLDAGLGAPSDVVQARSGVSDAVAGLVQARNAEAVARLLLAESLGLDPRTPINPAEEPDFLGESALIRPAPTGGEARPPQKEKLLLSTSVARIMRQGTNGENAWQAPAPIPPTDFTRPPTDADLPNLVEAALARRPELRRAEQNIAAAEFGLEAARKTNAPSVGATLGFTTRGTTNPLSTPALAAGITFSWPFADGGLTRGRVEEAEGSLRSSRADLQTARLAVVSEVGQAFLNYANAAAREGAGRDSVVNAAESVRLAEGRYAGGVGTFLEIITAQSSLDTARRTFETARGDRLRFRAALQRAIADPLPR